MNNELVIEVARMTVSCWMTWGDEEITVIATKRILKNLESSKSLLTVKIKKAQANPEIIS